MKRIRHIIAEGEVKASLLFVWLEGIDGRQFGLSLAEEDIKRFYHKKASLVLEVER